MWGSSNSSAFSLFTKSSIVIGFRIIAGFSLFDVVTAFKPSSSSFFISNAVAKQTLTL
jgi:hypothetical protein